MTLMNRSSTLFLTSCGQPSYRKSNQRRFAPTSCPHHRNQVPTSLEYAAWSPDPKDPPLYLDLPVKDGVVQPDILAKWTANAPLAFVDQYIDNLHQYRAIAMDVGDQDGLRFDTEKLHQILDNYGIENNFEIYHGTHTSAVADRFQNHVLPFFSKNLCATENCR